MNKSEKIDQLAAALVKFQSKVDAAMKDSKNMHFKSTFASLAAYQEAAGPILAECGLSIVQTGGINNGLATLVTTLIHSGGQWIAGELPLMPAKNDPQGQGSAITYARRYCYAAILGMVATDDDAEAAHGRKHEQVEAPKTNGLTQTTAPKAVQKIGAQRGL